MNQTHNNYIIEINFDNNTCTCVDGHQVSLPIQFIKDHFNSYANFKAFNYLTNQILPDNQFGQVWYTNHLNDHSIKINYMPQRLITQIQSQYNSQNNHDTHGIFNKIRLWYCPSNPITNIRIIVQYNHKWYWFEDSSLRHILTC